MDGRLAGLIIVLVLILALVGAGFYAFRKIRSRLQYYSRLLFGTSSIAEGVRNREKELEITPKSVSSATNLYLPVIMRDFPEFHYDEMKTRAENVLVSYLEGIDRMDAGFLTEGTRELKDALEMRIEALKAHGRREHFQNIKVHRTEISQYRRDRGRCSIVMQSAVEYIHYLEQKEKLLKGSRERLEQSRYVIELVYIQDAEAVEKTGEAGLGLNCPNCGAPISMLGIKECAYCGSRVEEFNIRIWNFSRIRENI